MEEERNWIAGRFNEIVLQKVIASTLVPGAVNFLETFSKIVPIYVVSATPVEELEKVLNTLDLEHYFEKIYGIPPSKSKILSNILKETGLRPKETIFIGDTNNDLNAAHANQIPFIARRNSEIFSGPIVHEMNDFRSMNEVTYIDSKNRIHLKLDHSTRKGVSE